MSRSTPTHCRIGVYGAGLWYTDRLGQVISGRPPREVIVAVLADPTLTIDMRTMRRLGLLPCDLRTDADQVIDLNRDLPAILDLDLVDEDAERDDLVVGMASAAVLGAFMWAAVLLWVGG